jgi:2-polyprenyl-6-methoxyphenol hydroxylase-like FAD-dependent oxidoreductase
VSATGGSPGFERVVIAGAGVAGLAAAAALRGRCSEIVLVEPDQLPNEPVERRGVPQSRQLHNLLGRAQRHLEELFPGFGERLPSVGGTRAAVAQQTHVFELGMQMPERDLGMEIWSATRPAVELLCRQLLEDPAVTWLSGSRVTGVRMRRDRGRPAVTAVELSGAGPASLEVDLIVDASGARSNADTWLEEAGCKGAARLEDEVDQWYVSAVIERPESYRDRPDFWLTFPDLPGTRGALLSPFAEDRWYLSVSGRGDDPVPRGHAQMLDHVASLPDPTISMALEGTSEGTEPHLYRRPTASWRRYDLLEDPPVGFLPIGDALGALNPLLGQGISVASWQAATLRRLVEECVGPQELTDAYHEAAAEPVRWAWQLGQLQRAEPTMATPRIDRVGWQRILEAVLDDADAHRRYVSVWHLLEPATTLEELAAGHASVG